MKEKIKLGIPIENEETGEINVILRTNEIRIVEEAFEEIERLHIIIEESIKLTNKVNKMESARDLYDLVVDIENKLKDSEKNES